MRLSFLGKWHSCCFSSFCSLMCCSPGSRLSLGSWSSVARSSWCSSWWRLKSSTSNWDFMLMGCSGSGTSCLSKLDLKLGSKFAVKGRGGQGGLTASCPDTTEGVVELVQLPAVGVEHLEVASPHIFLPESLRLPQTPSGKELDSCQTPNGAAGVVEKNGRQRSELAKVLMELSKCASTRFSR